MRPAGTGAGERSARGGKRARARTRRSATAAVTASRRTRARGDRGQVSVELLGITPLILVVLLLVWQFVLLGYTFTLAGDAADLAARAAAVGADPTAAAERDLPSAWVSGASVSTGGSGDVVTAHVALRVPVLVPGFVAFPFTVDGDAGAAKEQP